jgi:hypothetical protein
MAYGLRSFRKIQISNVEGTPGTAEAAVEPLYGTLTQVVSDEQWHNPDQDRGVLARNYETPFAVANEVELTLEGELYDRLAVYLFNNAIRGNVTPTQPDDSNQPNTYEWALEYAQTAANTPDATNGIDTFTLEYGDNVQAYEVEYLFTKELEITGAVGEPVTVSATMGGRQVTETTFTSSLTAQSAAYFPFNRAKFYVETDAYASIGSTQKTGLLRGFTWTFETMFTPLYAADGALYFTNLNEDKKFVNLEMTLYRDGTNSEALKDAYESQDTIYLRIELLGETEMDSGQSNPPYIYLDGAFKITEWPEVEDEDGTAVVTVTAQSFYDATATKDFDVTIGTTMDAYPS